MNYEMKRYRDAEGGARGGINCPRYALPASRYDYLERHAPGRTDGISAVGRGTALGRTGGISPVSRVVFHRSDGGPNFRVFEYFSGMDILIRYCKIMGNGFEAMMEKKFKAFSSGGRGFGGTIFRAGDCLGGPMAADSARDGELL